MEKREVNNYLGNESDSIVDAMAKIDNNARGVLFIVDNNNRLLGSLTDGDIRRWLLKSGELTASVVMAMNKNPLVISEGRKSEAASFMKEKQITAIPMVDSKKEIVDIVFSSEIEVLKNNNTLLSNVPVVIMAGGKGTRLYPYTRILPKPLIPIGETPIVERIMDYFAAFGMNEFYLTVNYKKAMIRSYFDENNSNYSIKYVEEKKPLGTGGSIKLIDDEFKVPFFVTNCDSLIRTDYNDIYRYHINSGNDITLVSALKNLQIPYGVLHTGDNGTIESIEEKPKLSYFVNTGMYILNPNTIDLIPNDSVFHMTDLIDSVMKMGGKVGAYPVSEDSFLDMGEFDEMKRMEEKLGVFSAKDK